MSVDDILEDVQTLFPKAPELLASKPPDIEGDLLKVYEAITSRETSIDEIIQRSGIGASSATVALLQLEMRHLVKQLPGKVFRQAPVTHFCLLVVRVALYVPGL